MKQYLEDEKVEEIGEIIEMKITHRKNLERRKAKFGYDSFPMIFVKILYDLYLRLESISDLGMNLASSAAVIVPDDDDGSPPEDPYA